MSCGSSRYSGGHEDRRKEKEREVSVCVCVCVGWLYVSLTGQLGCSFTHVAKHKPVVIHTHTHHQHTLTRRSPAHNKCAFKLHLYPQNISHFNAGAETGNFPLSLQNIVSVFLHFNTLTFGSNVSTLLSLTKIFRIKEDFIEIIVAGFFFPTLFMFTEEGSCQANRYSPTC